MIILKNLYRTCEVWNDIDDFYICFDVYVGEEEIPLAYEVYTIEVVSPKYLARTIKESECLIGRGCFIFNDFNLNILEKTIKNIIKKYEKSDNWENELTKYFKCMERDI